MIISICFLRRENAFTTVAKTSHLDDQVVTYQSVEDYVKEWHRFWLPLHHTVIFISNIWISASVKINWLWTWTLIVRTAAFQRTEKKAAWFLANRYGRISHQWKKTVNDMTFLLLSADDMIMWSVDTIFDRQILYFITMRSSTITQCDHLNFFSN